jgi:hypothetical protein
LTGGKLEATEKCRMHGQKSEVADKFSYLEVILEITWVWNKQKIFPTTEGYPAVVAIDKCISATVV